MDWLEKSCKFTVNRILAIVMLDLNLIVILLLGFVPP